MPDEPGWNQALVHIPRQDKTRQTSGCCCCATRSSHALPCNMGYVLLHAHLELLIFCKFLQDISFYIDLMSCMERRVGQALPEVQLVVTAAAAVTVARDIRPPAFAPHSMTAAALQNSPQADSNAAEAVGNESSADATARISSSETTASRPIVVEAVHPEQAALPSPDQAASSAAQPEGSSFGGHCPALLADGAGLLWPAQRGLPLLQYASRSGKSFLLEGSLFEAIWPPCDCRPPQSTTCINIMQSIFCCRKWHLDIVSGKKVTCAVAACLHNLFMGLRHFKTCTQKRCTSFCIAWPGFQSASYPPL